MNNDYLSLRNNIMKSIIVLILLFFVSSSLQAAEVTGVYEGTIVTQSGPIDLGFVGQTMQVEVTYEDSTTGTTGSSSTVFTGLVTSAKVTIAGNIWNYDGTGFSRLRLNDDDVIVFAVGTEDRLNLSVSSFTGPDLGTGTIVSGPSLTMNLSDVIPNMAPDGITSETVLPATPFDPGLFNNSPSSSGIENSFDFEWTVNDIEVGDLYRIEVEDFSIASVATPASVNLPLPYWVSLVLAGLFIVIVFVFQSRLYKS